MFEIRGVLTRLAARLPSGATALGVGASLDGAPEWHPVTSLQLPVPNLRSFAVEHGPKWSNWWCWWRCFQRRERQLSLFSGWMTSVFDSLLISKPNWGNKLQGAIRSSNPQEVSRHDRCSGASLLAIFKSGCLMTCWQVPFCASSCVCRVKNLLTRTPWLNELVLWYWMGFTADWMGFHHHFSYQHGTTYGIIWVSRQFFVCIYVVKISTLQPESAWQIQRLVTSRNNWRLTSWRFLNEFWTRNIWTWHISAFTCFHAIQMGAIWSSTRH